MLWVLIVLEESLWAWISPNVSIEHRPSERPHKTNLCHCDFLSMVLKQEAQLNKIADLIATHIPEAKRARLFGKELSYVLPRERVPE